MYLCFKAAGPTVALFIQFVWANALYISLLWAFYLTSREVWRAQSKKCPGIGMVKLYSNEAISSCLCFSAIPGPWTYFERLLSIFIFLCPAYPFFVKATFCHRSNPGYRDFRPNLSRSIKVRVAFLGCV